MLSPGAMTHLPVMMSSIAPSFPSYTCLLSFPWRLRSSVISSCCCRFPLCDGDWERRTDRIGNEGSRRHTATLRCISVRLETPQRSEVGGLTLVSSSCCSSCSIFSSNICSWRLLCSFSSSASWQENSGRTLFSPTLHIAWTLSPPEGHGVGGAYADGLIRRRSLACLLTLYALMKRTKTGKKTEGGIVLELSPKNVTASSNAS